MKMIGLINNQVDSQINASYVERSRLVAIVDMKLI